MPQPKFDIIQQEVLLLQNIKDQEQGYKQFETSQENKLMLAVKEEKKLLEVRKRKELEALTEEAK